MIPLLSLLVALVVEDRTPLLAAPSARAPQNQLLWRGDWVELRADEGDYLRVYHHRSERQGFLPAAAVATYRLEPQVVPRLQAIIEFLRERSGQEALGIAHVALLLRAAPPAAIDAATLDALGSFARALAARSRRRHGPAASEALARHLEVAQSYGLRFDSVARGATTVLCYDGDAFARVLSRGPSPVLEARALLALSDPDCSGDDLGPAAQRSRDEALAGRLPAVPPAGLPPQLANRLRLRRAEILARLSFARRRAGALAPAQQASIQALEALLGVQRAELGEADQPAYERAALAVAAVRWAREPAPARLPANVRITAGAAGDTCLQLGQGEMRGDFCTAGVLWPASLRLDARRDTAVVAVQPLAGWLELWILSQRDGRWQRDILVPAVETPERGYVEFAGFTPDDRVLVVREAWVAGRLFRRFQALGGRPLGVALEARTLAAFTTFRKWRSPEWQRGTLALR